MLTLQVETTRHAWAVSQVLPQHCHTCDMATGVRWVWQAGEMLAVHSVKLHAVCVCVFTSGRPASTSARAGKPGTGRGWLPSEPTLSKKGQASKRKKTKDRQQRTEEPGGEHPKQERLGKRTEQNKDQERGTKARKR